MLLGRAAPPAITVLSKLRFAPTFSFYFYPHCVGLNLGSAHCINSSKLGFHSLVRTFSLLYSLHTSVSPHAEHLGALAVHM